MPEAPSRSHDRRADFTPRRFHRTRRLQRRRGYPSRERPERSTSTSVAWAHRTPRWTSTYAPGTSSSGFELRQGRAMEVAPLVECERRTLTYAQTPRSESSGSQTAPDPKYQIMTLRPLPGVVPSAIDTTLLFTRAPNARSDPYKPRNPRSNHKNR